MHALLSGCDREDVECILEPRVTTDIEPVDPVQRREILSRLPFRRFDLVILRRREQILEFVQLKGIEGGLPWLTVLKHYSEFLSKVADYVIKFRGYEGMLEYKLRFSLIFYLPETIDNVNEKTKLLQEISNVFCKVLSTSEVELHVTYHVVSQISLV